MSMIIAVAFGVISPFFLGWALANFKERKVSPFTISELAN